MRDKEAFRNIFGGSEIDPESRRRVSVVTGRDLFYDVGRVVFRRKNEKEKNRPMLGHAA